MKRRFPQRFSYTPANSEPNENPSDNINSSPILTYNAEAENLEIKPHPRALQNLLNQNNPRPMRNSYPDSYSRTNTSPYNTRDPVQQQLRRLSSILQEQKLFNNDSSSSQPTGFTNSNLERSRNMTSPGSPEFSRSATLMARRALNQLNQAERPPTPQGLLRQLIKAINSERLADSNPVQETVRNTANVTITQNPNIPSKTMYVSDSSSDSPLAFKLEDFDTSNYNQQVDNLVDEIPNLSLLDIQNIENLEALSNLSINTRSLRDINIEIPVNRSYLADGSLINDSNNIDQYINHSLDFLNQDLENLFPEDALPTPDRNAINLSDQLAINSSFFNSSMILGENSTIDDIKPSSNNFQDLTIDNIGSSHVSQSQQMAEGDQSQSPLQSNDLISNSINLDLKGVENNRDLESKLSPEDELDFNMQVVDLENDDNDKTADLSMLDKAFIQTSFNNQSGLDLSLDVKADLEELQNESDSKVAELATSANTQLSSDLQTNEITNELISNNEDEKSIQLKSDSNIHINDSHQNETNPALPEYEPELENTIPNQSQELDLVDTINETKAESIEPTVTPDLQPEIEEKQETKLDDSDNSTIESEPEIDDNIENEEDQKPEVPSESSSSSESSESSDDEPLEDVPVEEPLIEEPGVESDESDESETVELPDLVNQENEIVDTTEIESTIPLQLNELDEAAIVDENQPSIDPTNEAINTTEIETDIPVESNELDELPTINHDDTLLSVNPPISPDASFTNNIDNDLDQITNQNDISDSFIDNIRGADSMKPILSPVSPGSLPTLPTLSTYKKLRKNDFNQISKSSASLDNLPASQVKSLVQSMTNTKLSQATLNSFLFATEKYFEQVSGDLFSYAKHAQRKVVNEEDVLCLFKRQHRIKNAEMSDWISLAQKQLPRDLWEPLADTSNPMKRRRKY